MQNRKKADAFLETESINKTTKNTTKTTNDVSKPNVQWAEWRAGLELIRRQTGQQCRLILCHRIPSSIQFTANLISQSELGWIWSDKSVTAAFE